MEGHKVQQYLMFSMRKSLGVLPTRQVEENLETCLSTDVTWSPNSNFLAIPIFPDIKDEILIFDVISQKEWGESLTMDSYIGDMVWVDD